MEIDLEGYHFLLNIVIRSLSESRVLGQLVSFNNTKSASAAIKHAGVTAFQQVNGSISFNFISYDTPPLMPMPGRFRNFFTSGSCAASNASPTQPTALETMAAEIGWTDFLTRKKSPTWYDLRLHSESALTSYDLWPMKGLFAQFTVGTANLS